VTAQDALKLHAELAYTELRTALDGVSEPLAWSQVDFAPDQYLHTNGSIIGIVQHIAVCKFMYGSTGFRQTEVRWRDCFARLEAIGTSWDQSLQYLEEASEYWRASWAPLTDLDRDYPHFRGRLWPAWKIIGTVTQHDVYHAGQIAVLASTLKPVGMPPDMRFEEERKHVMELPGW